MEYTNYKKEFQIPTNICVEAKRFMKHILDQLKEHQIHILGLDYGGLTLMAWNYHHWVKAIEMIEKEGIVVTETNARNTTITKTHPAVKIAYDNNAQLKQWMVEYGLTLKSRGKVDAVQGNLFDLSPELEKFRIIK